MTDHNDYLWDRSGPEDPEIKKLEGLLAQYRHQETASPLLREGGHSWTVWLMLPLAAAATLVIATFGSKDVVQLPAASWSVEPLAGTPMLGSEPLRASAEMYEGDWLITDDTSGAVIEVGLLGKVHVEPNSRVRLLKASSSDHRLSLASGTLHATIWAPPRLFFVETPSATAIDLGCAYTLAVDEEGRGRLCVTSGWVSLEKLGRETVVPSGAVCETRPGVGPGTPYFGGASDEFRLALARYDFNGGAREDLEMVLRESEICEVFTLWQLLPEVRDEYRGLIYDRMAQILPPPAGVTREGVLALDENMMQVWGAEFSREEFMPCLTSCTAEMGTTAGDSQG